jgi:hypothetical protein
MQVAENFYSWLADIPFLNGKLLKEDTRRLVKLNALLEKDAFLSRFNETLLEKRLNELEGVRSVRGAAYGLTFARINELALLCAGNYADHCEIQGVGDLLFNPRCIWVHIRGIPAPVVKKRHMALTEQFADAAATREGIVAWLRDETIIELKEKALLPHLYDKMHDLGIFSRQYLDSVNDRMKKIADVTGFLASGYRYDGLDFHQWLQHAGATDREFTESKLCRFDAKIFRELGNDFQQLLRMEAYLPNFLDKMDTVFSIG